MALTRSFKELVQRRVAKDPDFGAALLREGIDTMLAGDVDTGKAILRDYIKATVGFEKLGEATGTQPRASSACSARAAIRRPATCSASSAICKNRPACSCTSCRGRADTPLDDPIAGVWIMRTVAEGHLGFVGSACNAVAGGLGERVLRAETEHD